MRRILFFFLLLTLLFPAKALASFVYPSSTYPYISQTGQKAVVWYENGKETIILTTSFTNAPKDFGWLIPVPSKPEVEEASDEIFTALEDLTKPKTTVDRGPLEPPMMLAPGLRDNSISVPYEPSVVDSKQVGIFDVTVLESKDPKVLTDWLTKNNYSYPQDRSYILKSYTDQGWYFVAAKVNAEAEAYANSISQAYGHTMPLKMTFASDKIIYPIKLSGPGIPTQKDGGTKVAAFSFEQGTEGFYSNYPKPVPLQDSTGASRPIGDYYQGLTLDSTTAYHGSYSLKLEGGSASVTANGSVSNLSPGKKYVVSAFVKAQNTQKGTATIVTSSSGASTGVSKPTALTNSWTRLSTTFIAASQYATISLQALDLPSGGSINWDAVQIEEGTTATDFVDEIIPTPLYPTPLPYTPDVSLTMYVFADHKKTVPGFTTTYASFVAPQKITKLAFAKDGSSPWMEAKKKMYLTKLTRQMKPSEMTTDFIFRDADNNDPVNSEGLADFSGPRFFIIVFVILLVDIGGIAGFIYWRRRSKANVQPHP